MNLSPDVTKPTKEIYRDWTNHMKNPISMGRLPERSVQRNLVAENLFGGILISLTSVISYKETNIFIY